MNYDCWSQSVQYLQGHNSVFKNCVCVVIGVECFNGLSFDLRSPCSNPSLHWCPKCHRWPPGWWSCLRKWQCSATPRKMAFPWPFCPPRCSGSRQYHYSCNIQWLVLSWHCACVCVCVRACLCVCVLNISTDVFVLFAFHRMIVEYYIVLTQSNLLPAYFMWYFL